MNRILPLLIALLVAVPAAHAQRVGVGSYGKAPPAEPPQPPPPEKVTIDQNLGGQVPLDLVFRDEHGNAITIGQAMDGKPVILVLAYYRCKQLCNIVLNELVEQLKKVQEDVGDKFNVVVVSFDPKDGSVIAYDKRKSYVEFYGRPGAERGFRFLTGEQASIDALCKVVGFKYEYDPKIKEYYHSSGVTILTAQGVISKYHFGIGYNAADLRYSLTDASDGNIGTLADKAMLRLCMRYDPHTGKYSFSVMMILRAAAAVTVLIVGAWVFLVWRKNRRNKQKQQVEELTSVATV